MDTVYQVVRRLISISFVVFVVGVLFAPWPAMATAVNGSSDTDAANAAVWQSCGQRDKNDGGPGYCVYSGPGTSTCSANDTNGCACAHDDPYYPGDTFCTNLYGPFNPPPDNPCSSLTGYSGDFSYSPGQSLPSSVKQFVSDPNTGATVECDGSLSWSGVPTEDAYGHLHVQESVIWSTNPGAGNGAAGTSSYLDSTGSSLAPQPTETNGPSPQLCSGGSCYDPNANQFCATSGGSQFCVSGATADSSQGGCASSGAATLCAGSPTAPSPVGKPGSQVTNPATQIQSGDQYTQQNTTTGSLQTVSVNTYAGAGGSVSSGATSLSGKAANSGSASTPPASSSSSGNGDSFSGGGDCNTPPVCNGDAVMCGVAREAWQTSCNVTIQTTAFAGSNPTQQPPTFASDQTKYSQSDVWQQPSTGNTVGDSANNGTYDQSGFGYSTSCPMTDLTVNLGSAGSFAIPFSDGCIIGPWIYWTVIGFSLYRAARITAGSAI